MSQKKITISINKIVPHTISPIKKQNDNKTTGTIIPVKLSTVTPSDIKQSLSVPSVDIKQSLSVPSVDIKQIQLPPAKKVLSLRIKQNIDIIDQSWSIVNIATKLTPNGWEKEFKAAKEDIEEVSETLAMDEDNQEMLKRPENREPDPRKRVNYYPLKKHVFNVFYKLPKKDVRVVIIGQDPYHDTDSIGNPKAVGMAFSVSRASPIPPSLRNIYKELQTTIKEFIPPDHGDLTGWVEQGVFLLNTCLTVRPHQPKSHDQIWMGFIQRVLNSLSEARPKCIYLLWGKDAQSLESLINDGAHILKAAHPSSFSAKHGFFGCNHFNLTNEILTGMGEAPINWQLPF